MPKTTTAARIRVTFGDVVRLSKERCSNPAANGMDRYIGLEHIDPCDLKIRRWGDIANGTTFTNVFHPGQVMFGKRRAYQRKVAVAEFSGVCSGDIYVLEPKDGRLLPELLPFICQTDAFFDHAVGTSAGSLSPRTNWKSLADFEFTLPPLEEQRRIGETLQAGQRSVDSLASLVSAMRTLRSAMHDSVFVGHSATDERRIENVSLPADWKLIPASDLAIAPITSGVTPRNCEAHADPSCPFIKVGDLSFDGSLGYGHDGATINRAAFEETVSLHVRPGDVLTNIVGPPLGKVSIVPDDLQEALINQAIVRYRMPGALLRRWLGSYLMSSWAKLWLLARSKKTSGQRNINASTCANLPVPVPPENDLYLLAEELAGIDRSHHCVVQRHRDAKGLFVRLLCEELSK